MASASNNIDFSPVKILQVSLEVDKNAKSEINVYLHTDYANYNLGLWQISIKDVLWSQEKINSDICLEIKTNFVLGQYTETLVREPLPLGRILCKKNIEQFQTLQTFVPTWFHVNSSSNVFKVFIDPSSDFDKKAAAKGIDDKSSVKLSVTFMFKRIA
jgi:hypothetical protein